MSEGNQGVRRRPTTEEIEDWAFGLLERHLADKGRVLANVRRPDRENRATRDVDFLVEVDGRDIAVEVTQLAQARNWWNLLDRLETQVRAALTEHAQAVGAGWLILSVNLLRTATYREIDDAGGQIVDAVRDASPDLGVSSWEPLQALPEPAAGLAEIELRRLSSASPRLSFITSNEANGTLIAPRVLAFVRHLIASKATQGAAYDEVWILVIDNEVLIDLNNLADAFRDERSSVPPNWKRLFFLPATDRSDMQCLELDRLETY